MSTAPAVHRLSSLWLVVVAVLMASMTASMSFAQNDDDDGDAPRALPSIQQGQQLLQQQKWDEAAKTFQAIVDAQPENGTAWFLLGYSLHASGELDSALAAHLKAAKLGPNTATALYNAACVYSLKNDAENAFAYLEKARQAGFNNPNQLRSDTDMDNIRNDERFKKYLAGGGSQPAGPRPVGGGMGVGGRSGNWAQRAFDFWVGEWDVFDPNGNIVGVNIITRELNGKLIREHWRGRGGSEGMSMNYYNPATKKWVQVWVDSGGGNIVGEATPQRGKLAFEGRHVLASGESRAFRFSFTRNDDRSVHQFIEESTDDGQTWKTWFDGTYRRRTADSPSVEDIVKPASNSTGNSAQPRRAAPRSDFDFWAGHWNVFAGANATKVGTNLIDKHVSDFLLIEHWSATNGGQGLSFNYYDPATKQWVQVWVDGSGTCTRKAGNFEDGAMRMHGEKFMPDGSPRLLRATLTPNEDGSVTQLIEESTDDGQTWKTWFRGTYVQR